MNSRTNTPPLPELMASLQDTFATGTLSVRAEDGTRDLIFVNGELRAARSSVDSERLGAWLVESGAISDGACATGLLRQVGENASPLGHILVDQGHIDQSTLETELEELAITIVERSASHPYIETSLKEGANASQPDTLLNTATQQLILAAARALPDLDAKRKYLSNLDFAVTACDTVEVLRKQNRLSWQEAGILDQTNGEASAKEIFSQLPFGEDDLYIALYGLAVSGIVRLGQTQKPRKSRSTTRRTAPPPAPSSSPSPTIGRLKGKEANKAVAKHHRRCEELIQAGDIPGAVRELERICELDPRPENQVNLVRLMQTHKMHGQSILLGLMRTLETHPHLTEGWVELARYWQNAGSPERQRKAVERALHLDPLNVEALRLRRDLED